MLTQRITPRFERPNKDTKRRAHHTPQGAADQLLPAWCIAPSQALHSRQFSHKGSPSFEAQTTMPSIYRNPTTPPTDLPPSAARRSGPNIASLIHHYLASSAPPSMVIQRNPPEDPKQPKAPNGEASPCHWPTSNRPHQGAADQALPARSTTTSHALHSHQCPRKNRPQIQSANQATSTANPQPCP